MGTIRARARGARLFGAWPAGWFKSCLAGLLVSLTLTRLAAELRPGPWRLAHLALAVVLGVSLGLVGAGILDRCRPGWCSWKRLWPLGLLAVYLVWPGPALWLGAALSLGVLVACLITQRSWSLGRWVGWAILAAALALYASTCSRAVLGADAGEFQLVATVLGVAHPPGYALYTLLGHLFTWLPWGDPAFRVNLFSTVTSALTLFIGANLVHRETDSWAGGLLFATGLGLSATFWVQSTTANIRSLMVLLLILCVDALLRWRREPTTRRLAWVGLVFGLGAGHHSSLLLLAPAVAGSVVACDPTILRQPRRWVAPLGAFVASLLVWLYLPIRSALGSPFDPEPITSLRAFWEHVLALGFRGDMLHFRTLPELAGRLGVFGQILRLELGWPLVAGSVAGAVLLARRDWRALVLVGGIGLLNATSALTYRAPQTVEYLLPTYVSLLLALAMGLGGWRPAGWAAGLRVAILSGLLVAALHNGAMNVPSLRMLRDDATDERYAAELLEAAPEGALILSNWHHATSMWYLQKVDGRRPDVQVTYVYPEGATPNEEVWLRRIGEGLAQRPVVVTNWFYAFEGAGYRFWPLADGWQVLQGEAGDLPPEALPVEALFDEGMRLLGVSVDADDARPGGSVRVRVYWDAAFALERDYTGFVQLLGADGVLGQGDELHRADQIAPGVLQVDLHTLALLWHAEPGVYQLIGGFYYLDEDGSWRRCTTGGADYLVLGEVELGASQSPPASEHPLRVAYAGGYVLTGYDYDRGVAGETRLYLHWRRAEVAWGVGVAEEARVTLWAGDEALGSAAIPALAPGEAATVVVDMPGAPSAVGLTLATPDGEPLAWAGPWHLRRSGRLRLPLPGLDQRYVPMGGGVAWVGLQADGRGGSADGLSLASRWLALQPLTRDYAVSVGMLTPQGEAKADGTPAMGAIPTLKWLRGWQVQDVRQVPGEGVDLSAVQRYSVEGYDAFTLAPLQVLDERLVREGQGTRLLVTP